MAPNHYEAFLRLYSDRLPANPAKFVEFLDRLLLELTVNWLFIFRRVVSIKIIRLLLVILINCPQRLLTADGKSKSKQNIDSSRVSTQVAESNDINVDAYTTIVITFLNALI